jgi:regulator of nucleoside diphosphate kinase
MINPQKTITLSTTDHLALEARLGRLLPRDPRNRDIWNSLREELARASLLPPEAMPPKIVRVGSSFAVRDLDSDEVDRFNLVWPEHADVERGRLSVLTPLGVALIGFAEGDEITWRMPGGFRRLTLIEVNPPVNT